jgi:small-conductance mechanosensitive channel
MNEKLINITKLSQYLDFEFLFIALFMVLIAWFFYKLFLKEATKERHKILIGHHRNLWKHVFIFAVLFFVFLSGKHLLEENRWLVYVGLLALASGLVIFVKSARLNVLQYLFLGSMKHGVPVLLVNILSLIISLILIGWYLNVIFNIQISTLATTSAAVSLVLGLAMQETLGNLFAGISLQFDKSFEIGDWVDVRSSNGLITGQVREITWRATVLMGWTDELVTIPNRIMASSQLTNYTCDHPILRSQSFRLSYDVPVEAAKTALLESIQNVKGILAYPAPVVLINETTDSWLNFKLLYSVDNFGAQYTIGDKVVSLALAALERQNIKTVGPRIKLMQ